ncbi:MAG TPA: DUF4340 domain-containing protein [Phycisphaerae bacterium]|nr:DUF4340 domain-containing protein [Phycisphaerae bacterium]
MNPKTTIVLVVALVLAGVGVWLAQPEPKPVDAIDDAAPKPLLELKSDDVVAFEMKQGNSAALSMVKEDNKWRMTAPQTGPAESFAVNSDVGKIVGLQYEQAYDEGHADRPGDEISSLDNPLKIIKLTDKAGKSVVVKIGERQKLSKKTYVQIEGDKKVYLVNSDVNAEIKRKPTDYRGKRVAEFPVAEAVRVEVSGAENFTLVKSDAGWTLEEPYKARADLQAVNKILNGVSNMNALEFAADDPKSLRPYGLENPRLTIAITTEKKTPRPAPEVEGPTSQPAEPEYDVTTSRISLALGGAAEERVFAKVIDPPSAAVFQVNQSVVKDLGPAPEEIRDKKIAAVSPGRASQITITAGAESVTLVKTGATWQIASGGDAAQREPAEHAAVDDLLKAVREMKALGFEAGDPSQFGLADPRASIEMAVEGQTAPLKLLVGAETPSKTGAYLKNVTDDFVAVVPLDAANSLIVKPVSFRSREILVTDASNINRLEIARAGENLVLEKEGTGWKLTAPVEGSADSANVEKITADLASFRGRRVVAPAADAAKYGLSDGATAISLTVTPPAPATQATTQPVEPLPPVVHKIRVARHDGLVYAMKEGGAMIYEIDAKVADDLEAELLEAKVFAIDPANIESVAFEGAEKFAFEKKGEAWKLVGEGSFPSDQAKLTALFDAIRDLKAKRYVKYKDATPAEFGLDNPEMTIVLRETGGTEHRLLISPRNATEGGRYAATGTIPGRVFIIKPEDYTKLSKKVTDFRKTA